MANPENIVAHRWPKGVSGNPSGGKVGKLLKTRLKELMEVTIDYKDLDGKPIKTKVEDALGIALIAKALTTGDIKAIEMIKNELEGNAPKDTELSSLQKAIVQRAMERMLPDFQKMKEVNE